MADKLPGAGKFFLALLIFAAAYFWAPDSVRPWLAALIVAGALLVAAGPESGPLADFAKWYHNL
jgi:uncharacterized BrkB/YihY/UPF0761 family membrane protein